MVAGLTDHIWTLEELVALSTPDKCLKLRIDNLLCEK